MGSEESEYFPCATDLPSPEQQTDADSASPNAMEPNIPSGSAPPALTNVRTDVDMTTEAPKAQEDDSTHRNTSAEASASDFGTTRGAYAVRELHLIKQEESGELQFVYLQNDGKPQSMMWLIALKNIFSKQLPNMPKEYICRLVLERRHRSVAVISKGQCMGGITYRTYPGTSASMLGEIAFCAISASEQVKGYGTRLMNWTKEYARTKDRLSHFLTYADNNAVGYFAKQGFTKEVTLERERWAGFIKEYDGGTLMEFVIHPRMTYANVPQTLQLQLDALAGHLKKISNSHVVYPSLRPNPSIPFKPLQIENIPGVPQAGYKGVPGAPQKLTIDGEVVDATPENLQVFARNMVDMLKSHEQIVWPFLKPVSVEEASDYLTIVKNPMDLETISDRISLGWFYITLGLFLADLKRMWDNAYLYNAEDTIYYKYARQLEKLAGAYVAANVHS